METVTSRYALLCHADLPVFTFTSHSIIPQFPFCRWRNISSSNHEITKALALLAFQRISLDHGPQDGQDLRFRHGFAVYLVEPLTVVSTSEKHRVATRSLSDECHLCMEASRKKYRRESVLRTSNVGSSTSIGATSHTHNDGVVAQTVLLTNLFHFINQHWQVLQHEMT